MNKLYVIEEKTIRVEYSDIFASVCCSRIRQIVRNNGNLFLVKKFCGKLNIIEEYIENLFLFPLFLFVSVFPMLNVTIPPGPTQALGVISVAIL